MATLVILFVVVLLINLMPAFAPPAWVAMSWIGFNVPEGSPLLFAIVAASAATVGRLVLAIFARSLVRGRLMRESDRQNIGVIGAWLKKHNTMPVIRSGLTSEDSHPHTSIRNRSSKVAISASIS